jgi:hypothetical protein
MKNKMISATMLAYNNRVTTSSLYNFLKQIGWINRVNNRWRLTSKGVENGGRYSDSDYINWPNNLLEKETFKLLKTKYFKDNIGQCLKIPKSSKNLTTLAANRVKYKSMGATVTDWVEAEFGVLVIGGPQRFHKEGWFPIGLTEAYCPQCQRKMQGYRMPYTTKSGMTYHYWALACLSCKCLFEPANLDDNSRQLLYKGSEHRPKLVPV